MTRRWRVLRLAVVEGSTGGGDAAGTWVGERPVAAAMAFVGVLTLFSICGIRCGIFFGVRVVKLSGFAIAEESLRAGFGC